MIQFAVPYTVFCFSGLACTFDSNLCSWHHSPDSDFPWIIHSGPTPSNDTGPGGDRTTGKGNFSVQSSLNGV